MERHPVRAVALNHSCSQPLSGQRLNTTIRSAGMLEPSGLIYRWTGVGQRGGGGGGLIRRDPRVVQMNFSCPHIVSPNQISWGNSSKCSLFSITSFSWKHSPFTSSCYSHGLIKTKTHMLYYGAKKWQVSQLVGENRDIWQHFSSVTIISTPYTAKENGIITYLFELQFVSFMLRQESLSSC